MLHLAAAEQRVAVAGGMQRIWLAQLGTGNVRTLWPVPPREKPPPAARLLDECVSHLNKVVRSVYQALEARLNHVFFL
tara:strand:+ start:174 stop:407 length:234 start_codon:yes stop_codon:yes gene_type:complete